MSDTPADRPADGSAEVSKVSQTSQTSQASPPPFSQPLYPDRYVWFVLASAMDVLMTFLILELGGREVNAVAAWVIEEFGLVGMTLFKFALVVFVILLCQYIGRLRFSAGRRLAGWAVIITFIPVTLSILMLMGEFVF